MPTSICPAITQKQPCAAHCTAQKQQHPKHITHAAPIAQHIQTCRQRSTCEQAAMPAQHICTRTTCRVTQIVSLVSVQAPSHTHAPQLSKCGVQTFLYLPSTSYIPRSQALQLPTQQRNPLSTANNQNHTRSCSAADGSAAAAAHHDVAVNNSLAQQPCQHPCQRCSFRMSLVCAPTQCVVGRVAAVL
jgi:hypothetical protein